MSPEEIQALTEAAVGGDRQALDELLKCYLPEVRAFIRLRAGPMIRARESHSDLVQSVCREVIENAGRLQYPSESAFKRWLYTTALRKIMDRRDYYLAQKRDVLRDRALERRSTSAEPDSEQQDLLACYQSFSTPSRRAMVREEVERIEAVFEDLPPEYREVITLAHVVGLSRAEIAEQMGRTEGAVRMLLHRALAQVALKLQAGDPDARKR